MTRMDANFGAIAGVVLLCLFLAALAYISDATGLTQGRNSPFFTQSPTPLPIPIKKMPQRPGQSPEVK